MPSHPDRIRRNYEDDPLSDAAAERLATATIQGYIDRADQQMRALMLKRQLGIDVAVGNDYSVITERA